MPNASLTAQKKLSLIACDIDGTLLGPQGLADPALIALKELIATQHVPLTLCSGRSIDGLQVFADFLGVNYPMIADNGALIFDCRQAGEQPIIRKKSLLPAWTEAEALALMQRFGSCLEQLDEASLFALPVSEVKHLSLYLYKQILAARFAGLAVAIAHDDAERVLIRHKIWEHDRQHLGLYDIELGTDFWAWAQRDIYKIFVVDGQQEAVILASLAAALKKVSHCLNIVAGGTYLDIMPATVNKGEALAYLRQNSCYKAIAAIGDSYNDVEFLQMADFAASVANAKEHLTVLADYRCRASYAAGVLEFVKYLLAEDLLV